MRDLRNHLSSRAFVKPFCEVVLKTASFLRKKNGDELDICL
jgi:hypothetical protein